MFSSVSAVEWGHFDRLMQKAGGGLTAYVSADESLSRKLGDLILEQLTEKIKYQANPTIYRVHKNFRFIKTEIGKDDKRSYQLQSIAFSSVVKDLIKFSRNGKTRSDLTARILQKANCSAAEAAEYFEFLKDAQLLLAVDRANITGPGHLHLLCAKFGDTIDASITSVLEDFGTGPVPSAARLQKLSRRLQRMIKQGLPIDDRPALNVILKRELRFSQLSNSWQARLREGLWALQKLCSPHKNKALEHFVQQFRRHFEGQRIPLLLALDPERGIGYQEAVSESPNPLLETLNIHPRTAFGDERRWSDAHRYLLERWLSMESTGHTQIELEPDGLNRIPDEAAAVETLGFSVLFRLYGNQVFLESAGGTNAPAMLGRFTATDQRWAAEAVQMARSIEAKNPAIIFAELLHLADPRIDNVNRRAQIWRYELPLTAAAHGAASGYSVQLDDLFVEVKDDLVLLWSKRHDRYVITRSTSAYNHSIDELPLYRFLADLSYQHGISTLAFDLRHYFPGLKFYPRVTYSDTILSPATWVLNAADVSGFRAEEPAEAMQHFLTFARNNKLPGRFALSEGDQQLVFDQTNPGEMTLLLETIKGRPAVILQEFLLGGDGDFHIQQFNAFVLPDQPISMPEVTRLKVTGKQQRKFIPGSEWLYLKIYVSRLGAGRILLKIWPLLKKEYGHGKVQQWFFIRYDDHAPHIRLRIKLNPQDINTVLLAFRELLEDHIHEQVIREYQLDVYSRELERYQLAGIERTEKFFAASSHFVLCYLAALKRGETPPAYIAALVSTYKILQALLPDNLEREQFLSNAYTGMLNEFEGKHVKIEMDQKFRETRPAITEALNHLQPFGRGRVTAAIRRLESVAAELRSFFEPAGEGVYDYIHSIMHMHLNRLFTDEQRKQEMLIYFLLFKWLTGERARKKR